MGSEIVKEGKAAQAIIVNSGIANACTGAEGYGYCKDTADAAAKELGISADSVLLGSTGVIGKQLPIDRIQAGVKMLAEAKSDTVQAGTEAAKAIMTTDTCEKEIAVEIEIGGKTVTIGGMAKGSGMIHPNMCTMLSFITTDAAISKTALQKALSEDVDDTYNMIFCGWRHIYKRYGACHSKWNGRKRKDCGRNEGIRGVCRGAS